MKIYGYTVSKSKNLEELKEVSFIATKSELVALADFFLKKSSIFESDGSIEHVHFSDFMGDKTADREIVLCNPLAFPVVD